MWFLFSLTLTKKFGALLLLLTAGSLAGILTFTLFFIRTSGDGVYLIASEVEQGMLQQLQIQTLAIRDGDDSLRAAQLRLIEGFDVLINAMHYGGRHPARPLTVLRNLPQGNTDSDIESMVRAMQELLPKPPPDLEQRISGVHAIWMEVKESLRIVGQKPADDPAARAAYDAVKPKIVALDLGSRLVLVSVGNRITSARERMLVTLASIAALSLALFFVGLWFTKRYISRPIEFMEKVARRIHAGDFSQRVPVLSGDEVASLARAMNEMSEHVERSVAQYRELFENASDILYTMTFDGTFLTMNRAVERVTGYPRDKILKMNLKEIVSPEQLEISNRMMQRKLCGEQEMTTYPLQIIHKDGHTVSLEVGTRLIYEDGRPVAVQGLARDITERRRLEEQLWMSQKMEAVGRLAGGIAHEFGNVLTIISGYCALLLSSMPKADPLRDEVEGIQKAGQRATSLIRHLLGFSKGQVFRPKVLHVRETLAEIGDMLRRLIGEDIRLITTCDAGVGNIRFDPAQFEQVMVNLALNARDAMPSGGQLSIEAQNAELSLEMKVGADDVPAGSYVALRVSDTGSGMTADVASKIFEPFFSTKERGTGLGLFTVYGIVKQSGGSIAVESAVGRGTSFSILLPRFQNPAEPLREEPGTALQKGTETILLVEDNDDVRAMVCEMLRTYGYNVVAAQDQQQAISICSHAATRVDLLLTDVVMPEMSGPELVSRVRTLRPAMKILYMSGYAEDKFEPYIEKDEHFDFIQKPLSPEALAIKVREVLDAPRNGTHG